MNIKSEAITAAGNSSPDQRNRIKESFLGKHCSTSQGDSVSQWVTHDLRSQYG